MQETQEKPKERKEEKRKKKKNWRQQIWLSDSTSLRRYDANGWWQLTASKVEETT